MSRRRTGERYVPITISLKPSMIDALESELNVKQSRSQWIAKAIQQRLDGNEIDLEDFTLNDLFSELMYRGAISQNVRWTLQKAAEDKLPDSGKNSD